MELFKKIWFTPKFPQIYIDELIRVGVSDIKNNPKILAKNWIYNPIKRRIAKYYLSFLRKYFNLKVIAVTGSAGKTSTKDMIVSIIQESGKTVGSYKNIDPVYNIPSTILRCRFNTEFLVLEMGVEYPGEMDFYLWLAKPDIAVITNIYPTHTQYFKNTRGVFEEKKKIVTLMGSKEIAVLNNDDIYLRGLSRKVQCKVVLYGKNCSFKAEIIKSLDAIKNSFLLHIKSKVIKINLSVIGEQFVSNALAAAAVANILKIDSAHIKEGLEKYQSEEHRMNISLMPNGVVIVDDSYNSNPKAAEMTIKSFKNYFDGKKLILVLGDMMELGEREKYWHRLLGKYVSKLDIVCLICVGERSKWILSEVKSRKRGIILTNTNSITTAFREVVKIADSESAVLIKGSRSVGLDKLVSKLSDYYR